MSDIINFPRVGAYEPRDPKPKSPTYDEAVMLCGIFLAGAALLACIVIGVG